MAREDARFDPGSFRDPGGRVRWRGDSPERVLSADGRRDWVSVETSGLLRSLDDRVVPTSERRDGDDIVLVHERIPLWTYPYEWSFTMLKRAAELQLEILVTALEHGQTLKDATPYNFQFRGTRPVFVDLGSFRPYRSGEPWLGYGQFCRLFLYPLLIQAHAEIPFQPLLRGSLNGIDPEVAAAMLRGNRLKAGVALDVVLQAKAQRRAAGRDVREELANAGFKLEMIQANLKRLRNLVSNLEWKPDSSTWSDYARCDHVASQRSPKAEFVASVMGLRRRRLVFDLGANDGHFSRIAAEHADLVLAADGDALVVDRLFRELETDKVENIVPLVYDISDPSPGLGWRGRERQSLEDRAQPDLVMLLAVIHHLVVGGNLPLSEVTAWLRSFDCEVIFEWVPRDDPMAIGLAVNKRSGEVHADYEEASLRKLLDNGFDIAREDKLEGRILFHLIPR